MAASQPDVAFVWIWLPGATEPVPAGRLDREGAVVTFRYGRGYLDRPGRIALYDPELPLQPGPQPPQMGDIASCIADAGPDAWGMRVIEHRRGLTADATDLGYLTYLLESSSDRIGGLDFQPSPNEYVPRDLGSATLDELVDAARRLENDLPLSPALSEALVHGSSVGGARPKALLEGGRGPAIAKFSSSTDVFPFVKTEALAMDLAGRVGLDVAPSRLVQASGKEVLIVDRFDRPAPGQRRSVVSARTMLRLGDLGVGGSYADLADLVRARFTEPLATLRELFGRITFNILVGNTDDHPKNHAAFWDGADLTLTPAYDISPQPRTGNVATQAMEIGHDGFRYSQVAGCVQRAGTYGLSEAEGRAIVNHQLAVIEDSWEDACDAARLTSAERMAVRGRQFVHPFALEAHEPTT